MGGIVYKLLSISDFKIRDISTKFNINNNIYNDGNNIEFNTLHKGYTASISGFITSTGLAEITSVTNDIVILKIKINGNITYFIIQNVSFDFIKSNLYDVKLDGIVIGINKLYTTSPSKSIILNKNYTNYDGSKIDVSNNFYLIKDNNFNDIVDLNTIVQLYVYNPTINDYIQFDVNDILYKYTLVFKISIGDLTIDNYGNIYKNNTLINNVSFKCNIRGNDYTTNIFNIELINRTNIICNAIFNVDGNDYKVEFVIDILNTGFRISNTDKITILYNKPTKIMRYNGIITDLYNYSDVVIEIPFDDYGNITSLSGSIYPAIYNNGISISEKDIRYKINTHSDFGDNTYGVVDGDSSCITGNYTILRPNNIPNNYYIEFGVSDYKRLCIKAIMFDTSGVYYVDFRVMYIYDSYETETNIVSFVIPNNDVYCKFDIPENVISVKIYIQSIYQIYVGYVDKPIYIDYISCIDGVDYLLNKYDNYITI